MTNRIAASLPAPPDMKTSQRVAQRAEDLGYESVWIADVGGPDPFVVVAAAAAAVTGRVRIGTAVIPAYTRTPPVIAGAAASCAELAPGRFVLGVGASSVNIVEGWSGIPFRRPLARVRETVTTVRAILAGERTDFDGRTLATHGYRLLMRTPEPAIPNHVGALMPPMLELAGEIADGVTLDMMPVEAVPRMLEHVRAGVTRAGRDPARDSRSWRASRCASPTTSPRRAPSCARCSARTSRPRSTTASSPGAASPPRRRRSSAAGRRRTAVGSPPVSPTT
jgi:alkanesulfonate monooxygenase SsuD/methylene tetrahydromethanopterin reductase-like flavin-dependent oxidoreductase (luciferase family)